MNAASLAVAFASSAWIVGDLCLLLALAGAATAPDQPAGNRIWLCLVILTVFLACNAYALDSLGRHFGF